MQGVHLADVHVQIKTCDAVYQRIERLRGVGQRLRGGKHSGQPGLDGLQQVSDRIAKGCDQRADYLEYLQKPDHRRAKLPVERLAQQRAQGIGCERGRHQAGQRTVRAQVARVPVGQQPGQRSAGLRHRVAQSAPLGQPPAQWAKRVEVGQKRGQCRALRGVAHCRHARGRQRAFGLHQAGEPGRRIRGPQRRVQWPTRRCPGALQCRGAGAVHRRGECAQRPGKLGGGIRRQLGKNCIRPRRQLRVRVGQQGELGAPRRDHFGGLVERFQHSLHLRGHLRERLGQVFGGQRVVQRGQGAFHLRGERLEHLARPQGGEFLHQRAVRLRQGGQQRRRVQRVRQPAERAVERRVRPIQPGSG